jgi:hypothetical protein
VTPSGKASRANIPLPSSGADGIDLEHVIEGTGGGGVHWVAQPGGAVVEHESSRAHHHQESGRTWRADVTMSGAAGGDIVKQSTMFPTTWSAGEVREAIWQARLTGELEYVREQDDGTVYGRFRGRWRGLSIEVEVDVTTGRVLTAFPAHAGRLPN